MATEPHPTAQKPAEPAWLIIAMLVVFAVWLYVYLVELMPPMNSWLARHGVTSYPAMLHLVPILAVPITLAALLTLLPSFKRDRRRSADRSDQ